MLIHYMDVSIYTFTYISVGYYFQLRLELKMSNILLVAVYSLFINLKRKNKFKKANTNFAF